jgi:hypothetical protein
MTPEEESPHYNTCTHRMDGCIIVKDAEQVAVLWDPLRNIYHYSVRVKDWFGCSTVSRVTYDIYQESPILELGYIQEKARFLESLHR